MDGPRACSSCLLGCRSCFTWPPPSSRRCRPCAIRPTSCCRRGASPSARSHQGRGWAPGRKLAGSRSCRQEARGFEVEQAGEGVRLAEHKLLPGQPPAAVTNGPACMLKATRPARQVHTPSAARQAGPWPPSSALQAWPCRAAGRRHSRLRKPGCESPAPNSGIHRTVRCSNGLATPPPCLPLA